MAMDDVTLHVVVRSPLMAVVEGQRERAVRPLHLRVHPELRAPLLVRVLHSHDQHLRASLERPIISRGREKESRCVDGPGCRADLGNIWRAANDDFPVCGLRQGVAVAPAEARALQEMSQALRGVLLAERLETHVPLNRVQERLNLAAPKDVHRGGA